jgi:uncharacterized protein YcnI
VPAAAAALVILAAAAASAHVTVHSPGAREGGSATLTFKVPNEEPNATTKQVEIDLPTATPLTGVTAQAPAGWTSQVTADKVVFSGGTISGDNSVSFPIKVEKLPMSPTVVFKALQTYSDGNVVRWIDQAAAGAPEPAHPAPVLKLLPAVSASASASPGMGSMSGMDMNSMPGMQMKPGQKSSGSGSSSSSSSAAKSSGGSSTAPSKVHAGDGGQATVAAHGDDGDGGSGSGSTKAAPSKVKAGDGGQASESATGGIPVAPLTAVVAGLGVAGLAARRLVRR